MRIILKLLSLFLWKDTNLERAEKEDLIKIVRLYSLGWIINEYFRGREQEYDFENMKASTLKSMNNKNMIHTI